MAEKKPTFENNIDVTNYHYAIVNILQKYRKALENLGYTYDDIVQIGYVGILKAKRKFDESKGYTFLTYATRVIHGEYIHAIQDDKYHVHEYRKQVGTLFSLNTKINDIVFGEVEYQELIVGMEDIEFSSIFLKDSLEKLTDEEKQLLYLNFYLEHSKRAIGKMLNMRDWEVSRKIKRILEKLRKELEVA